jgi:DNA-binding beta-propeller fold protein YncE
MTRILCYMLNNAGVCYADDVFVAGAPMRPENTTSARLPQLAARWGQLALLLAVAALAGCATAPPAPKQEEVKLVWPAPPEKTRIRFERSLISEEDISTDTTFSQDILNILAGEAPPPKRVSEPMGVVVSDDGKRIYVSCFNRGAVFGFDFEAQRFQVIEPLVHPAGLALDGSGRLYVVEQGRKSVSVRDREGNEVGTITHPTLQRPVGIAIDHERGRVYVVDTGSRELPGDNVKVFDTQGQLLQTIGSKGGGPGQFSYPTYAAVDREGNLYVSDTLNARVQKFDPQGRYLMTFGQRGNAPGMFERPKGVAVDSFGNVYVADSSWSNVQIFNRKGEILLFFGGRGPLPGMLKNPTDVYIDPSNRIYVTDFINHRLNVYQLVNTTAEDSLLAPVAVTR